MKPNEHVPNAARLYDYYLGGAFNFATDRNVAEQVISLWPNVKPVALYNRTFLRRVVEAALDAGITQFLDLGSGVPTAGNVHQIALESNPQARVVYVDNEPVAYHHNRMLLEQEDVNDRVAVVQQDLRKPSAVLEAPETRRLLDFTQPVAVLMVAVLHFVGEDDSPAELIEAYRAATCPGSWLAASHIASDDAPVEQQHQVEQFRAAYAQTSNPLYVRTHEEVAHFFAGYRVLEPGIVHLPDWRPDGPIDDPTGARPLSWCAVGEQVDHQ